MTENYDSSFRWAIVGEQFHDPLLFENWEWAPRYAGNITTSSLINCYSNLSWIYNYVGYYVPYVGEDQLAEIKKNAEVIEMPCFPADGSVRVIDDVVVIKPEDIE